MLVLRIKGKKVFSKKTLDFTKEEEKEINNISNLFLRDEVDIDEIILRIQQNVSADKLENISPVEILADYGGDAVKRIQYITFANITELPCKLLINQQ